MAPNPEIGQADYRPTVARLESERGITDGRQRLLKHRRGILDHLGRGEGDVLLGRYQELGISPAEARKEMRYALSMHFLQVFWDTNGEGLFDAIARLTETDLGSLDDRGRSALLVNLFIGEELPPEDLCPPQIVGHLVSAAKDVAKRTSLESPDDVSRWIRAHSLILLASAVLRAAQWESAGVFLDSPYACRLWDAYQESLASGGNYASPTAHLRAGIEGYALIYDRLAVEIPLLATRDGGSNSFSPSVYGDAMDDAGKRLIWEISRWHMRSFVGLDGLIRADQTAHVFERDGDRGEAYRLSEAATRQLWSRAQPYAEEDNARALNRIGCPFFMLSGSAASMLHDCGFGVLAHWGVIPRAQEIHQALHRMT